MGTTSAGSDGDIDGDIDGDMVVDHGLLAERVGCRASVLDEAGDPALALMLGTPQQHRTDGGVEQFLVDLTGPAEPRLGQATYRVRLGPGEEAWWFLVPTRGDETSTTYTLSVSRALP